MRNRKGLTLFELLVVIAIIILILAILIPAQNRTTRYAPRLVCGTNIKGLANAMHVYAFDNRDEFPIAGGKGERQWASFTDDWNDPAIADRDNLTVAASLFMLVREADVGVKSFLCTNSDQTPFVNNTGIDIVELWDFGPNPTDHQSYSYHYPYGKFPADATSPAGNAIMADRSPWFDEKLTESTIENESSRTWEDKVSLIEPDSNEKLKYRIGNSHAHNREGQNIMFGDGHVSFEKRPDVGTEYDNIYTIGGTTQEEKIRGIAPTAYNIDAFDENDSLLVNDRTE